MFIHLNCVFALLLICAIRVSDSIYVQPLSKDMLEHFINSSDDSPTTTLNHSTDTTTQQVLLNQNITATLSATVETTTDSHKTSVSTSILSTTPFVSEVSVMMSNQTYKGGTSVDETGEGHHQHSPPKEVSRINHSKPPGNGTTLPISVSTTTVSSTTSTRMTSSTTTPDPSKAIVSGQDDKVSMPIKGKSTSSTAVTGIVAFVCVGIAASAFVCLLAYRHVYRKRHGNREILINEEDVDFNDEDLRHFEATCIQLEPEA